MLPLSHGYWVRSKYGRCCCWVYKMQDKVEGVGQITLLCTAHPTHLFKGYLAICRDCKLSVIDKKSSQTAIHWCMASSGLREAHAWTSLPWKVLWELVEKYICTFPTAETKKTQCSHLILTYIYLWFCHSSAWEYNKYKLHDYSQQPQMCNCLTTLAWLFYKIVFKGSSIKA